jgi:hypothetical protein
MNAKCFCSRVLAASKVLILTNIEGFVNGGLILGWVFLPESLGFFKLALFVRALDN